MGEARGLTRACVVRGRAWRRSSPSPCCSVAVVVVRPDNIALVAPSSGVGAGVAGELHPTAELLVDIALMSVVTVVVLALTDGTATADRAARCSLPLQSCWRCDLLAPHAGPDTLGTGPGAASMGTMAEFGLATARDGRRGRWPTRCCARPRSGCCSPGENAASSLSADRPPGQLRHGDDRRWSGSCSAAGSPSTRRPGPVRCSARTTPRRRRPGARGRWQPPSLIFGFGFGLHPDDPDHVPADADHRVGRRALQPGRHRRACLLTGAVGVVADHRRLGPIADVDDPVTPSRHRPGLRGRADGAGHDDRLRSATGR